MGPLRQRLIDEFRLRNYSPCTIEAYLGGSSASPTVIQLPDRLGFEDSRRFQLSPPEQEVSW